MIVCCPLPAILNKTVIVRQSANWRKAKQSHSSRPRLPILPATWNYPSETWNFPDSGVLPNASVSSNSAEILPCRQVISSVFAVKHPAALLNKTLLFLSSGKRIMKTLLMKALPCFKIRKTIYTHPNWAYKFSR